MKDHDQGEGCTWIGFDWTRERYEDLIRRVVPGYQAQEPLIVEALREAAPGEGGGPFRILELGAGTGALSYLVLETFPGAELTAMDVSPVMLGECAGGVPRLALVVMLGWARHCSLTNDAPRRAEV